MVCRQQIDDRTHIYYGMLIMINPELVFELLTLWPNLLYFLVKSTIADTIEILGISKPETGNSALD